MWSGCPLTPESSLGREPVGSVWRWGFDLDGSRTVLGARRSDFRLSDRGPRAALDLAHGWGEARAGDAGAAGDRGRGARADLGAGGRGRCGQGVGDGVHPGGASMKI